MSSLFVKQKIVSVDVLKLPTYCIPTTESESLAAKREAQLEWMRQKGMRYLGDPLNQVEPRPVRRPTIMSMRLVSVRRDDGTEVCMDDDTGIAREA